MTVKHSRSYWQWFGYGWLASFAPFFLLAFVTPDPAYYMGSFFSTTLIATLVTLVIDKFTDKKMSLRLFMVSCLAMTVVLRLLMLL